MREEENKRSSQKSSFKRFFKKRWVFPAIYI
ncbi:MAG TPA: M23 family peptidase, partial [Neobacillus sp.]